MRARVSFWDLNNCVEKENRNKLLDQSYEEKCVDKNIEIYKIPFYEPWFSFGLWVWSQLAGNSIKFKRSGDRDSNITEEY